VCVTLGRHERRSRTITHGTSAVATIVGELRSNWAFKAHSQNGRTRPSWKQAVHGFRTATEWKATASSWTPLSVRTKQPEPGGRRVGPEAPWLASPPRPPSSLVRRRPPPRSCSVPRLPATYAPPLCAVALACRLCSASAAAASAAATAVAVEEARSGRKQLGMTPQLYD
jgi:hypothetical protein